MPILKANKIGLLIEYKSFFNKIRGYSLVPKFQYFIQR